MVTGSIPGSAEKLSEQFSVRPIADKNPLLMQWLRFPVNGTPQATQANTLDAVSCCLGTSNELSKRGRINSLPTHCMATGTPVGPGDRSSGTLLCRAMGSRGP